MASKRSAAASRRGKVVTHTTDGRWTVPKGKDVHAMTRDASRQVIKNYGDALGKLKKH